MKGFVDDDRSLNLLDDQRECSFVLSGIRKWRKLPMTSHRANRHRKGGVPMKPDLNVTGRRV